MSDMDEIWALFADDGSQSLDAMEDCLEALSNGDGDETSHISALFRAVHTFKGNSRVLGLGVVESRAHVAEDLIGLVRDDGVAINKEILDILFYTADTLRTMLEEVASTHQDVDPAASTELQEQLVAAVKKYGNAEEDEAAAEAEPEADVTPEPVADEAPEEAEPVEEEVAEVEEATAEPQESEPTGAVSDIPKETVQQNMALDPVYQNIFTGMATETIDQLGVLVSDSSLSLEDLVKKAKNNAGSLSYAASQLSLTNWSTEVDAFDARISAEDGIDQPTALGMINELIDTLNALLKAGFEGDAPEAVEPAETATEDASAAEDVSASGEEDIKQIDESELYEDKVQMNMALDPVYQNIFVGMAKETIDQLGALVADGSLSVDDLVSKATNKADSLSYAASQLALTSWIGEIDAFLTRLKVMTSFDQTTVVGMVNDLIDVLKGLLKQGFGDIADEFIEEEVIDTSASADDAAPVAKKVVKRAQRPREEVPEERYLEIFNLIDTFYTRLDSGDTPSEAEMQGLADRVSKYCETLGFTRAADVASRLNQSEDLEKFRATQLKFFEEIASIEDLLPDEDLDNTKLPSELLGEWCAFNADDTLDQVLEVLNAFVKDKEHGPLYRKYDRLMRQCYHVCSYYKMATGVHLALALVDLFSRSWQSGSSPAAMVLRLSFSFVDKTRPIFRKVKTDEVADLDPLDRLFEEALTAIYAQNGTVSAKTVEKRLGLPEVFRNILSPESVSTAMTAMQNRLKFYIIRTDIQNDEEVAQAFFEFLKDPQNKMVTNVTIFQGDDILFDFLLATPKTDQQLHEALMEIDPSGEMMSIHATLEVEPDPDEASDMDALAASAEYQANEDVMRSTLAMVEAIGEISAGQAMVQHMLSALTNSDLMMQIENQFREEGVTKIDSRIRAAVRSCVDEFSQKLKSAAEAELQLTEKLAQLQQESVAVRSRSAEHLLRQLSFYVVSQSRKRGAVARTFTVGADVVLDQMVMENLRDLVEPILASRIAIEPIPSEYHISIQSEGDRATIVIEDDGSAPVDEINLRECMERIEADGGELRVVDLPDRGVRFHVTMPLHMIVLDGMVVKVGDVNYVIPIDSILRIQQTEGKGVLGVSASEGQRMLEIGNHQHVPIHRLAGSVANSSAVPKFDAPEMPKKSLAKNNLTRGDVTTFVIVRNEDFQMAIPVDELMGQQLVLLRPLRGVMSKIRDLSGVALLAGGEVGMVLAVNRLLAA